MIIDNDILGATKVCLDSGRSHEEVREALRNRGFDYSEIDNIFEIVGASNKPYEPDYEVIDNRNVLDGFGKVDNPHIHLYVYPRFLTPEFCSDMCELIRQRSEPSEVMTTNGQSGVSSVRISKTLTFDEDLKWVDDQISQLLQHFARMPIDCGEPLQGQFYTPGGFYKPHYDYFKREDLHQEGIYEGSGQRTWTCMMYLNEEMTGGETVFPEANLAFSPERGTLVIWNNLLPDGRPNPRTLHSADPVGQGEKFIFTKWYRTFPLKLDT